MDQPTILSVRNANKSYNNIPALIDASLDLRPGEVHALIGENGAGKTTLIKLLAGVLAADSIDIRRDGRPVVFNHPQDAFDAGLQFIHQELNVVPQLSAAENVSISRPYPTRAGVFVNWKQLNARAQRVFDELDVRHIVPATIMARLSPGDQMLVKVASAFVDQASIYVMDEPTAALTGEEAAKLFNVIRRITARGAAVLYVSHRLDEIFTIAHRVTVMRDGRVVATKAIDETSTGDLIRLMTGRDLQQTYPGRQHTASDRVVFSVKGLRTRAIRDVAFDLREGELLGVAGLNGSGRTELLRALLGADRVLGGEIWLEGEPVARGGPAAAWNRGITYVPEERRSQGVILSRSVKDNITLSHLARLSRAIGLLHHQRLRQTSVVHGEAVRLRAQSVEQHAWQLSGGNQQKVIFARALAKSPRVLLLDEPTRGIDVGAKYDIYTLIRQINAEGTGIIMVSCELPELIGMCDRILVMRRGEMVDVVPAEGLTEADLLGLCYGDVDHDS